MELPFGRAEWGTDVVVEDVLGWPCRVFKTRPKILGQLLAECTRHSGRDYLVSGTHRLGFDELAGAAAQVAARLAAEGLKPGDRLLLLGGNSIPWAVTAWAALCHGWVLVPGNAWWSAEEIAHAVDTVDARLSVVDARRRERLPAGLPTLDLETILDPGAATPPAPVVSNGEDDPAVIVFTSGTTSFPKGATLTHRGILANLHSLRALGQGVGGPNQKEKAAPGVTLMTTPLFHVGGVQQILTAVLGGATLVFLDGRFDPRQVAALIEEEGVTAWGAVPTMISRLLDVLEAEPKAYDLSSLRTLSAGGSFVPEALRARAQALLPNVRSGLGISYGSTEAGMVAIGAGRTLADRPGAVGRLLPTVEARIENPDAEGVGELLVRSPGTMRAYWGQGSGDSDGDVLTSDRWIRTGDVARLDGELLSIVGRSKDIVIRGGENIAASRVEERLLAHPAVAEVMVAGLPHPDLGEEVAAAVVLRPGHEALDVATLAAFAAETLAYFEVPTAWWFRETLPVNASGKVLKRRVVDHWPRYSGAGAR